MNREKKVCLVAILFSALLGCSLIFLGTKTTLPGPDSKESITSSIGEQVSMAAGLYRVDKFIVVLTTPEGTVKSPAFIASRDNLVDLLVRARDTSGDLLFTSVKTVGHSWLEDDIFISKDNRNLLVISETKKPIYEAPALVQNLVSQLKVWQNINSSVRLSYSSSGVVSNELFELINRDLDTSLKYTVPITLCILIWTFGSLGSSLIAGIMTALSLISSLGIASLFSYLVHPISATAAQLVVLVVMAIGTDYALFFIARLRQEMQIEASLREALTKTSKTTGAAIFWSGLTVAVSLTGLFLVDEPILTSMAAVSIIAVLVTLALTLRLLPPLLLVLQNWINWGQIRAMSFASETRTNKWAVRSVRHPITTLCLSLSVLISLGYFCASMNLGSTMQAKLLPNTMQSSEVATILEHNFPAFSGTELTLVLHDKELEAKEEEGELEPFFDSIRKSTRLHGPFSVRWSDDRTTARYDYKLDGTSQDKPNQKFWYELKNGFIPNQLGILGVQGFVTGKVSYDLEQEEYHREKIFLVVGSILGASLFFIMFAFESIIIPIKAFLLNSLSAAAAFGVLVLLFQNYGWRYGVIESFVPSLLFSILFGLSMDYHLLLISRIREYVLGGESTKEAVIRAISDTYGVISGAATIMTSVFLVISFLELPLMKQLGIGLACAVILDATIVRCLLLPSSIVLLGDLNWYIPRLLKDAVQSIKRLFNSAKLLPAEKLES